MIVIGGIVLYCYVVSVGVLLEGMMLEVVGLLVGMLIVVGVFVFIVIVIDVLGFIGS